MTKRKHQLLTESERDQILAIPTDRDHLARLYTFEPSDIEIIGARRERRNQLGVALQLALLRHPGITLAQLIQDRGAIPLYTCNTLGTPGTIPANLGGITFLDNDTLLIGGAANGGLGAIYTIDVVRGAGNQITGFSGPSTLFARAPNIDGGLSFGPGGVLFATTFSDNRLLQYLPGSTDPDRSINLSTAGISGSTGTLAFVPAGFGGAGSLKIASYSGGGFYDVPLIADGSTGLYNIGTPTLTASPGRGPEGIVYVSGANAGFSANSLLLSEYGTGTVGAYTIDANGNPIVSTRRDFLTGLGGAEGAVIDPLTGDFLFSTFGGANQVVVISGFVAPPTQGGVPEPATWAMMIGGFGIVGGQMRRRRQTAAIA